MFRGKFLTLALRVVSLQRTCYNVNIRLCLPSKSVFAGTGIGYVPAKYPSAPGGSKSTPSG